MKNNIVPNKEYQYGFSDKHTNMFSLEKGLSIDVIKKISKIKKEPK
jgi:Fe-S cluster assembly protein SufB